jgi:glycine cleavage system aminomethyltransferase T
MLPSSLTAVGSEVQVEIPGVGARSARVVVKPFVDPKKEIPKA